MTQTNSRRLVGTIGTLQIVTLVLVAITALIHLQRGIGMSAGGFGSGAPGGPPPGAPSGPLPGGAPGGFNLMQALPLPLPTLFLLNGIGYIVLVIALYLPALYRYQRLVRWLLILFAAVTFLLYFAINGLRMDTIGLIDKVAELALISLLLIQDRQPMRSQAAFGHREVV